MPINFKPQDIIKHNVFIETGTYTGKTVAKFAHLYDTFHTIEIVESFHTKTKQLFTDRDNIIFHLGDSPTILREILREIDEPVTFWLDAHYQSGKQSIDTYAPIMSELSVIREHHINSHMIMIDDVRLFSRYNTNVDSVKSTLLQINDKYKICFKDGIIPNDVLVAYIQP